MDLTNCSFGTKAVHGGQSPDPETGALLAPMFMNSTYVWTSEKMERYLSGDKDGIYTYGRSRNPTQNDFQDKVAILEGAEAALATASGMAAISLAIMNAAHSGDHIIASRTVYGGTYALLTQIFEELKIDVTFVEDLEPATLDKALRPNTKAVYAETLANPTLEVVDMPGLAAWAKKNNVISIIDSTFTSPYIVRPLELGIDVVVHSTTKYINGHGDIIGGVIAGSFKFVDKIRSSMYQELGPVPSPFSCWLQLRGLKTLHLRMKQHCHNALTLARWLEKHPAVEKVIYPGLESHPHHALAKSMYREDCYGGIVSFNVKGGIEGPKKVIDACHMAKYCVSLGDLDTLIEQPATMTHGKIARDERYKMGIEDGMIRVSVGVEDAEDIIAEFEQALKVLG